MARIFVSYRRQDRAGHAGRIYDHLRMFFGTGRVFMDMEGIEPGTEFTKVLDEGLRRPRCCWRSSVLTGCRQRD
jgi:hypothetical protein